MTTTAKVFISSIAVAGIAMLVAGVYRWASGDILRFVAYLALSLFASTLKVRLPGSESTISASFLFVLIGISSFTISETLLMGCSAALLQTLWKPKQYMAIQGVFSVGSWALSITFSYWLSHLLSGPSQPMTILLPLATFLFFGSHVGLAALAVALTTQRSFAEILHSSFLWSFPYYLFGAIIAGLCSVSVRTTEWWPPILVLPLMYWTHVFYRTCVDRLTDAKAA